MTVRTQTPSAPATVRCVHRSERRKRRSRSPKLNTTGGTIKDAQAQLGHTKLSTTLEIYTLPVPNHQREAVENLAEMVTSSDEPEKRLEDLPSASEQIQ